MNEQEPSTHQAIYDAFESTIAEKNALIESLRKQTQWQPIETAPKDGKTHILAYEEGGDIYRAAWDAESECWSSYCGQYVTVTPEPTHWQPLPQPPQQEKGE